MRISFALLLVLAAADRAEELDELRDEARTIIKQSQELEITTTQARRKVQLLLNDFKTWAETHDVELETQSRTYNQPPRQRDEPLTTDRCPLFVEEELDVLCPLDLARSEVWGAEVVFCRYLCE